jgi:hypothetical protein
VPGARRAARLQVQHVVQAADAAPREGVVRKEAAQAADLINCLRARASRARRAPAASGQSRTRKRAAALPRGAAARRGARVHAASARQLPR